MFYTIWINALKSLVEVARDVYLMTGSGSNSIHVVTEDGVLVFDSEVLEHDTEVTGPISATLFGSSDAPDTDFTAALVDVHPGGRAIILCEGICRARFRHGMDTPEMITEALTPMMHDEAVHVVNLMGRIDNVKEFEDPNNVKVVVGPDSNAIYFSREPIPSRQKSIDDVPMLKQICVIPFRRDYLLKFNKTPETPLERIESVDMLRVIESGGGVRMVMTEYPSMGVDTPQDLETVGKMMIGDLLMDLIYNPE